MCGVNITNKQYQTDRDTNNSKELNGDKREHMINWFI
jgi:hypothetical protein